MKPFIKGMGRVMSSLHLHVYFLQTTPQSSFLEIFTMYRPLSCQRRLRNSKSLPWAFISLDRGEICSYVESKESQAFDTVQLCLQRKAWAGPDHGVLPPGLLRQYRKSRCPRTEPSTGNQNPSGHSRSKAWELSAGHRLYSVIPGFSWSVQAHNACSDENTSIIARQTE